MGTDRKKEIADAVDACFICEPGDTLITMKQRPDYPRQRPTLNSSPGIHRDAPTSADIHVCDLPFEARALVIQRNGCGWVYVLCEGRMGWISHTSVSHLEPADDRPRGEL